MKSVDPKSLVPITARSLETLQRLTGASARMRLSDTVSRENVEFAKKVFITSLKDVGIYMKTWKLDAGVVNCGKSHSQVEKVQCLTVSY